MKQPFNLLLFVQIIDQVGGAEVATRRWADLLVKRGHHVTLFGTQAISHWRRDGKIVEWVDGLQIIRVPVWQRSRQMFDLMLSAQSLVVLLFMRHTQIFQVRSFTQTTMMLARLARWHGMRTISVPMASGPYGDIATLPGTVSRTAAAVFDWVVCLTPAIQQEIVDWGYPIENTSVIPNGVDTSFFAPPAEPPHPQSAIFVGNFRPEKRIDLVLEAWHMLQEDYPTAYLTLVGGGRQRETYEQRARDLGVRADFVPTLPSAGVLEQLQRHAIFIMSGVSEGMSNALLEGMSVGLAPVVSDTPANRSVINPGVNGLVYESESAAALHAALRQLFEAPEKIRHYGEQARKTVLQSYGIDRVVDQYLALYEQLLSIG